MYRRKCAQGGMRVEGEEQLYAAGDDDFWNCVRVGFSWLWIPVEFYGKLIFFPGIKKKERGEIFHFWWKLFFSFYHKFERKRR